MASDKNKPRTENKEKPVLDRETAAYLQLEAKLLNTLDVLLEGVQIIDFDYRYIYVNDAVVKQSKYSKKELFGSTMMERYPGIETTEMFAVLKSCMEDRKDAHFENQFTFPDGSKGWFELRMRPVPEGLFILSMDITDRKKIEEERLEYIRSIEEMMFMTSHRVRKPLSSCLGLMDLIDDDEPMQTDELKKIIEYLKSSALELNEFTHQLTEFIHEMEKKKKAKGILPESNEE